MNVLVTNRQENELSKINLEIIKTLRGEFSADEIISTFSNYYFNKMILDLTAIKNYENVSNIQKLSLGLDVNKIIILLPEGGEETKPTYLSKLISMGLYNFTTKVEGIEYLYNNPNAYKDVVHLHNLGNSAAKDKHIVFEVPKEEKKIEVIRKVIGFKNITDGAGSTSIVYMLKRELENFYGVPAKAIEVNKRDFIYLGDKTLVSTTSLDVAEEVANSSNFNIILIDLNDANEDICDEVIYLIEPSNFKLNKLKYKDPNLITNLSTRKVILNKCTLANEEIAAFERANSIKVFSAIRPFNDMTNKTLFGGLLKRLEIITDLR